MITRFLELSVIFIFFFVKNDHINVHCASASQYIPEDWIDPSDMRNYDRYDKVMKVENKESEKSISEDSYLKSEVCLTNTTEADTTKYNIFIERLINRILKVTNLQQNVAEEMATSEIAVTISVERLTRLKKFGEHFSVQHLTELDEIFTDMLVEKSALKSVLEKSKTVFESLLYGNVWLSLHSNEALSVLCMGIITIQVIRMYLKGYGIGHVICFLYLLSFVLGLIWNFWRSYQEALVKQFVDIKKVPNVPGNCDPSSISFFDYIKSLFLGSDDCFEYYKTRSIDPLFMINPSLIFSETFITFLNPLSITGKILQEFCLQLSNVVPWPLNLILYPLMLIITLVFVFCVAALCLFQGDIGIWSFFGRVTISNRSRNAPNVENSSTPASPSPAVQNSFSNCSVLISPLEKPSNFKTTSNAHSKQKTTTLQLSKRFNHRYGNYHHKKKKAVTSELSEK